MNTIRFLAMAVLSAAFATTPHAAPLQAAGIHRTDLQRQDVGIAGREVIQVRVDIASGATAPKHRHPGEEFVYVLKGSLEYQIDGQPPVTLQAGDVYFIPSGAAHRVKNVGDGDGAELATYLVDKDQPLIQLVK